jgi:LysR family glycine cleavage system transcriptional activator
LGRRAVVIKDLADGRLVAPYGKALNTGAKFRFLCASGTEKRPQIDAFKRWMLREIDKTAQIAKRFEMIERISN